MFSNKRVRYNSPEGEDKVTENLTYQDSFNNNKKEILNKFHINIDSILSSDNCHEDIKNLFKDLLFKETTQAVGLKIIMFLFYPPTASGMNTKSSWWNQTGTEIGHFSTLGDLGLEESLPYYHVKNSHSFNQIL